MIKFDTHIPPPPPFGEVVGLIRTLPANKSVLIPKDMASTESVRSIVTRVRGEFANRMYQTAKENGGVRVWRTQ